jgi:hypothetical protein
VRGQRKREGRGKEGEGEESFAHRGIPFVCFCAFSMRPSGGGVKVELEESERFAWRECPP